jgi:replicative DNA helicase
MANLAEEALYAHLTSVDSLDYLIKEGFTLENVRDVIPTEVGRKLVLWAIEYYFENGRKVAPSKDAIMTTWGDQLTPLDIEINDDIETDSVQWAVDQLRHDYADYMVGDQFVQSLASAMRKADGPDRVNVALEYSQLLHVLTQSLISRKNEMDGAEGLSDAIDRYEQMVAEGHQFRGMTFGLPEIDDHIRGVHPGEIAVVAATSGGGKSWFSLIVLLEEFKRGRKTILFTLENDVEMTFDRIACVKCRVDYEKWQRGEVEEGDLLRVKEFLKIMEEAPNKPIIVQPAPIEATGAAMVRRAIIEECDSIIIDQLSHIQPVVGSRARQRNEVIADIVRDLHNLINQPGMKIPLLLLHQINRKGREEARKIGRYLMEHMGEATQVENDASHVLAIYQSPDHEIAEQAEIQMLKCRRMRKRDWEVTWRPGMGDVRIRREVTAT